MDYLTDTIAAVATPYGKGGISIVRISGPEAIEVADSVFLPHNAKSLTESSGYTMRLGSIVIDGSSIDEVITLLFRTPHSYTGEDLVEIQCHGGPVVTEQILRGLLNNGARIATAGEFTRRAVINDRITLSQAEGINEIISAVSRQGEQAAYAVSKGLLSRETERMKQQILTLQGTITAYIDFPEEDTEMVELQEMEVILSELKDSLRSLLSSYETGLVILNGIPIAIVGSPNVGKSTIMNLLTGYEKSIVTSEPGTTRDVVEHQIRLAGVTLLLSDTAGIRSTDNLVERIGVERAYEQIEQSALILLVFDSSRPLGEDDRDLIRRLEDKQVIAVVNKIDLEPVLDRTKIEEVFDHTVCISANDEQYLKPLSETIQRVIGVSEFSPELPILINERQRQAVSLALEAVEEAKEAMDSGMTMDIIYISLDNALYHLLQLTGENLSETILDEVFSKFCVGK